MSILTKEFNSGPNTSMSFSNRRIQTNHRFIFSNSTNSATLMSTPGLTGSSTTDSMIPIFSLFVASERIVSISTYCGSGFGSAPNTKTWRSGLSLSPQPTFGPLFLNSLPKRSSQTTRKPDYSSLRDWLRRAQIKCSKKRNLSALRVAQPTKSWGS